MGKKNESVAPGTIEELEPLYEISDLEMMDLPGKRKWYNRHPQGAPSYELAKSSSGQSARVNWNLIKHAVDSARHVVEAYASHLYPNGLGMSPVAMGKAERDALVTGFQGDPNVQSQVALEALSNAAEDIAKASAYVQSLSMFGSVLMSKNTMRDAV